MAIVSWNARGLNGGEALRQTKLLVKYHKLDLLLLMETKLAEDLRFQELDLVGRGLMVMWKDNIEVTYLTTSSNHFSCFLRLENQPRAWQFCGFYGEPKVANRHYTWDLLLKLKSVATGPWMAMGDFNEILSQEDKEGGGVKSEAQIEAFWVSVEVCALQPLDFRGDHFTWIRKMDEGSIKERLDWVMVNEEWLEWFPNNYLAHLEFF
ncbi:uncharacterized protein LOC141689907 [Apium graveolens]|uniref:uncharacterized protein LOC141689907 n=1 Tax=Apium graveolens TaxID=4045 RepID=UPI003D7AACF1